MVSDQLAAQLRGVADFIDQSLADEHTDGQAVAEIAAERIRYLAIVAGGEAAFERRQPATDAVGTTHVRADGPAQLSAADLMTVLAALRDASCWSAQQGAVDSAVRYDALRFALGDDRG